MRIFVYCIRMFGFYKGIEEMRRNSILQQCKSKKRVRRAMLIGSCAPCDSVPRSKLEERSWLVWHEPLSVAIVWALNLTYIEEFFSFARVLRHFVLVPCEICVVPFGHRKIAADWNDISLAKIESLVEILTHACASLCSFNHGYLSL